MEVLGNAAAMKAIRQHAAGKLSLHPPYTAENWQGGLVADCSRVV